VSESFWRDQLPPARPRAPLTQPRNADVCIVGAGFTGLWTAYELRRAAPELDVVVLEAQTAGFGASGRNGGWVLGELAGHRDAWARKSGRDGVVALQHAIEATVDEVGRVVAEEDIACDFHKGGSLHVAQTPLELRRIRERVAFERKWGELDSVLLDAGETQERIAIPGALGARFSPHCARVQPARLAAGLAEAAERAGAVIHERSPVTRIEPGRVETALASVRARWVVRATEAYTARLPGLRRALVPMTSAIIVTAPLAREVWERIGWEGRECLLDGRRRYVYIQRTEDGRIAIGGRGLPYRFASRTDREDPLDAATTQALRARLRELFPAAADAAVDGAWHGVLGVPRDWTPAVGADRATGLAWAGGYVGEGVAAANLAGRTLRDLLLERDTELTRLPWVGPLGRAWEPEPLRYVAVRGVYALYGAADRREVRTGRPALAGRVADAISGR
jgi:glycine/D-amino acid oxidase-like deaminating enzyme